MSSFAQIFPPALLQTVGGVTSLLNQPGSLPSTVMFTAPDSGVYFGFGYIHLVATDNTGTLTGTLQFGPQAPVIGYSPNIASGQDSATAPRTYYLRKGDQVIITMTATGLTATTYNLFVIMIQLL